MKSSVHGPRWYSNRTRNWDSEVGFGSPGSWDVKKSPRNAKVELGRVNGGPINEPGFAKKRVQGHFFICQ